MFRFISRFIARFRKPKVAPGPSHWTPEEIKSFDEMIECFDNMGTMMASAQKTMKTQSGKKVTFRRIPEAVAPAIVHPAGEQTYDYFAQKAAALEPYKGTIGTCGYYAAKAASLKPKDA